MPNLIYCEDKAEHINIFLKNFCGGKSTLYGYKVTVCRSSKELLKLAEALKPEIVLTDIDLNDGQTGIEAAEELLTVSPRTRIIYVTSYTDKFIQDVFLSRANVCGFLNKPIEKEYLKKMIEKAEQQAAEEHRLNLPTGRSTVTVYENDILYIESYKRTLTFHLANKKSIAVYGSLSDYIQRLSDRFILTHQSFAVNKIYVAGIKKKDIFLTDGTIIPVSRNKLKEVRGFFMTEAENEAEKEGE